jgi:hypothetical protein
MEQNQRIERVNVAPTSTDGHFAVKHKRVVCLDANIGTFFIEGKAELRTAKHHTLPTEGNCLIMPQWVYNPYKQMMEKSKD